MESKETTGEERMPVEKQPMIERMIMYLQKEESLKKLHHYVMDPLLNHILERVFPYIVLTCVRTVLATKTVHIPKLLYKQHIGAHTAQRQRNDQIQVLVESISNKYDAALKGAGF